MEIRNAYRFCSEILKGRFHSEDLDIDERKIFKWMTEKHGSRTWTGFI
jgi:hypothetical protein